jgi:hypothetical protein
LLPELPEPPELPPEPPEGGLLAESETVAVHLISAVAGRRGLLSYAVMVAALGPAVKIAALFESGSGTRVPEVACHPIEGQLTSEFCE